MVKITIQDIRDLAAGLTIEPVSDGDGLLRVEADELAVQFLRDLLEENERCAQCGNDCAYCSEG